MKERKLRSLDEDKKPVIVTVEVGVGSEGGRIVHIEPVDNGKPKEEKTSEKKSSLD